MLDMIGDDTGENISIKNPYYSELTAQYWAWKNVHDVKYVGFCHYRRLFNLNISQDNIDSLFRNRDVILLGYTSQISIINEIRQFVSLENLTIFLMVLKKLYPEYEQTTLNYMWGTEWHPKNMLICRKELFDSYAEWMFSILFECEKYIKLSPYSRERRVYGYFSEFFMPVYMIHNKCRIYNTKWISYDSEMQNSSFAYRLSELFKKIHFSFARHLIKKPKTFENFYREEIISAFKTDGIKIE